jgi:hypothetical protein
MEAAGVSEAAWAVFSLPSLAGTAASGSTGLTGDNVPLVASPALECAGGEPETRRSAVNLALCTCPPISYSTRTLWHGRRTMFILTSCDAERAWADEDENRLPSSAQT